MTDNQKILLRAMLDVKRAHATIIDVIELVENTIGEGTPLHKKLEHANDCVDLMTEFLYEFFGNDTHNINEEIGDNFFYWINNDKYKND